jgi:hypothetical protein
MSMKKISTACLNTLILCTFSLTLNAQEGPVIKKFKPFVWKSDKPEDCPFKDSEVIVGLKFLGIKSILGI